MSGIELRTKLKAVCLRAWSAGDEERSVLHRGPVCAVDYLSAVIRRLWVVHAGGRAATLR